MLTNTVQLRVTLPAQMQIMLEEKASQFGMTLSSYVRNLVFNDIKENEYPVFQASAAVEKSYKKAIQDRKKAKVVGNLKDYFNNL